MKVIDTRTDRALPGQCVKILPANERVSQEDMKHFYGLVPGSFTYSILAAPVGLDRLVIQRGDVTDRHFNILTRYAFYELRLVEAEPENEEV